MATKLVHLVEILSSRGGIVRTTTSDNAWAIVAAWRRLYWVQDKVKEEELDELEQIFREEIDIAPVEVPEIVQSRLEFARQHFRDLALPPVNQRTEEQVIQQPNLQVPAGEEYLYLAQ
eukprot:CAMPEP_0117045166 /NCGR_PEP_ID=MMETSP0472-20121206/31252_1 /TAXON_ID=693140 ORGANISM="Tiarina fusus, Strain LIS" /NCGR_SAMPLE_ID=MMETSP0472 /ASSEMBLY_ACC=CAM_ASM_000603 /LENGTH=117 /DNA_ID=CAMNT_0004757075 /DNA_START=53 /DNA_END=406 /DNA_ORIENTATION=+